jgi:hypothetical protein
MAKIKGKYIEDATIAESKLDINNTPTNNYTLKWNSTANKMEWGATVSDSKDVKVSANDTTPGFLNGKLVGTANVITLTENNDGGNETLTLNIGTNVFNKATNTTDNITQGSTNKFYSDSLVSTYIGTQKGIANGLATLDSSAKIPTSQLPDLAITKTHVVASQVAQLALTVQEGDVAVRTDINKSFIALNSDNVDMGDWQELLTPTGSVTSVNGETGSVTLDTDDIDEGTNKYYSDSLVDNHLSGGTGITYSAGTISINQASNLNFTGTVQYKGNEILTSASGAVETSKQQIITLTSTNITNKYVDLAQTPVDASAIMVTPVGGILQEYNIDYSVSGNRISWSSLGLDGLLAAGDKLIVNYTY